jgi:Xaa-Pro aminopeptidase
MSTFDISQSNSKPASKNSYDTEPPPNLINFMLKGWKPMPRKTVPIKWARAFKERRRAISKMYPGEILIIPTGHEKVRSNDTYFRFRPSSDFFYLAGNAEPDCVLVMVPDSKTHREILFVEPNPGKTDKTFFTDRNKGELWVGPRLGVSESGTKFGFEDCRGLPELEGFLTKIVSQAKSFRLIQGSSDIVERALKPFTNDEITKKGMELATALSEMRLIKDAEEVKELANVIRSTHRGFEDVIRRLKGATSEREVEGVFYTRARLEGNDVGYYTTAASGAHACTLHWGKNDGKLRKGDLLLLDAGVEGHWLYTADITRTLPISGKFSKEQREIYEIVHSAQAAAFKEVKPGNDFMAPNRAAQTVIAQGLERLGILPTTAEEALKSENQFYKRYSLHGVSHMLGIDVHDCAKARAETYRFGALKPGMVLTVEPGLYLQLDDLTVPPKYRGIGIRIEDDVVVTEKGCKNLSGFIPSEAEAVEKWMKTVWKTAHS